MVTVPFFFFFYILLLLWSHEISVCLSHSLTVPDGKGCPCLHPVSNGSEEFIKVYLMNDFSPLSLCCPIPQIREWLFDLPSIPVNLKESHTTRGHYESSGNMAWKVGPLGLVN